MFILFDPESSLNRMVENLKTKESVEDVLISSTSVPILSVVADEIGNLSSADEYLSREEKWDLARNYSSLIYQGRFRGYKAKRAQGASTSTVFVVSSVSTFDAPYAKNIPIPKWSMFITAGGITFTSSEATTLLTSEDYKAVPIVQGIPKSYTYNALGENLERVQILNSAIEETLYDVIINGETWTEIEHIEEADLGEKVYEIQNIGNFEGVEIIFGTSGYGKKLEANDLVVVKYLETLGSEGDISAAGLITGVVSTIFDADGGTVTLYCTNTDEVGGGKDIDTVEEIRRKGLDSFKGGDTAVDYAGYNYYINNLSYIEKAVVWGAYEVNKDAGLSLWTFIPSEDNVVHVSAFTPAGDQLTDSEKEAIIFDLADNQIKPPCDILQFTDAEFIWMEFHIVAYVYDRSVILSEVVQDIKDTINSKYSISNMSFKQPLYDTQWKGVISAVDNVYRHTSEIKLVKYETFNIPYEADCNLPLPTIEQDTVSVYVRDTTDDNNPYVKIAQSSGSSWVGMVGYTVSGTFNHSTGLGGITVDAGLTGAIADYQIKYIYTTDSLNFEPTKRYQILKIDSVDNVSAEFQEI